VAGIIKMVLAITRRQLPATLHVDEPTPHVDWSPGGVRLLTEALPWPDRGRPRRAGVSSFGISGTNAHVILEQPPAGTETEPGPGPEPERGAGPQAGPGAAGLGGVVAWPVSGKSAEGLAGQAARLAGWASERTGLDTAQAGRALARGRAQLEHRAVVLGSDAGELVAGLGAVAEGRPAANVVTGTVAVPAGRIAFVFSGQGSQWPGMGRELYQAVPAFAASLDEIVQQLDRHLDQPLLEVMFAGPDDPAAALLHDTSYTQPALFALETALARLLMSYGLEPDCLLGHSVGELAAVHLAGMLSLADAATLVTARARLMRELPAGGAMTAINATEEEVASELHRHPGVSIAAINSRAALVISGDGEQVGSLARIWHARGRKTTALRVSHAFHSPLMDPVLEPLRAVAARLDFAAPRIPVVSDLSGRLASKAELADPDYWARHARDAVRYHDGICALAAEGVSTYVEIGPHPVLIPAIHDTLQPAAAEEPARRAVTIATLHRDRGGPDQILTALAHAHVRGIAISWPGTGQGTPAQLELPTYAFQHQRYWLTPPAGEVREPAAPRWEEQFWDAVDSGDATTMAAVLRLGTNAEGELSELLAALAARRRQQHEWYQARWQPAADAGAATLRGTWLTIVPGDHAESDFAGDVIAAMAEGGAEVIRVVTSQADDADRLRARLHEALADACAPAGVLCMLTLDQRAAPGTSGETMGTTLTRALLPALAAEGALAPVWSAGHGTAYTGPGDDPVSPAGTRASALSAAMLAAHPAQWAASLDLPERLDQGARAKLRAILARPDGDPRIAVRGHAVFVRRLLPLAPAPAGHPWQPAGTVLVTGDTCDTAGLGAQVARWLASHGASQLILAHSEPVSAGGRQRLAAELAGSEAGTLITECDTADRGAVSSLLAAVPADRPVTAVIHVDQPARPGDTAAMDAVTNLDELTRPLGLAAFVVISPTGGLPGLPGTEAQAVRHAGLEALVQRRCHAGFPAVLMAWGPWADGAGSPAAGPEPLPGVGTVRADFALDILHDVAVHDGASLAVARTRWEQVSGQLTPRASLFFSEIPAAGAARPDGDPPRAAQVLSPDALRQLPASERTDVLIDLTRGHVASVLGQQPADVELDADLMDMGFTSFAAVELSTRLKEATGVTVPPGAVYDDPTITGIASYISGEYARAVLENQR
jgi:acyl transferase domain-containing protein/acyl carrier protein